MTISQPHSRFEHVYAIVRFHFSIDSQYPMNNVTVANVFSSEEAAGREASRLNHINSEKSGHYDVYATRFVV